MTGFLIRIAVVVIAAAMIVRNYQPQTVLLLAGLILLVLAAVLFPEHPILEQKATTCCYAKSDKQWIADPQGVPWETFLTYGESTVYGEGDTLAQLREATERAVCEPAAPAQSPAEPVPGGACCAPSCCAA